MVVLPVTVKLPPTETSLEAVTLPVNVDVPVTAKVLDNVVAPVTPKVVPTVAASSTVKISMVAVPSNYKPLNSKEAEPKSISLSVTGRIAPSAIYIC